MKATFLGTVASGNSVKDAATNYVGTLIGRTDRSLFSFEGKRGGKSASYTILSSAEQVHTPYNPIFGTTNLRKVNADNVTLSSLMNFPSLPSFIDEPPVPLHAGRCNECGSYQVSDEQALSRRCIVCSGELSTSEIDDYDEGDVVGLSLTPDGYSDEDEEDAGMKVNDIYSEGVDKESSPATADVITAYPVTEEDCVRALKVLSKYSAPHSLSSDGEGKGNVLTVTVEDKDTAARIRNELALPPAATKTLHVEAKGSQILKAVASIDKIAGDGVEYSLDGGHIVVEGPSAQIDEMRPVLEETGCEVADESFMYDKADPHMEGTDMDVEDDESMDAPTEEESLEELVESAQPEISSDGHVAPVDAPVSVDSAELAEQEGKEADATVVPASESECDKSEDSDEKEEDDDANEEEKDESSDESSDEDDSEEESADMKQENIGVDLLESVVPYKATVSSMEVGFVMRKSDVVDGTRWYAIANGTPIAYASQKMVGSNSDVFHQGDKFKTICAAVLSRMGIRGGLKHLGYKGIQVNLPVSRIVEAKVQEKEAEVKRLGDERVSRVKSGMRSALSTAAVGINRGFWRDEIQNPIREALIRSMSAAGVANAEDIIDDAFEQGGDKYHATLSDKTFELLEMSNSNFDEMSRAIASTSFQRSRPQRALSSVVADRLADTSAPAYPVPAVPAQSESSADTMDAFESRSKSIFSKFRR